jgi:hypothetical protein
VLSNSKQNCWQEIVLMRHLARFLPFNFFIHAGVLGVALLEYLPEKNDPVFLVIIPPMGIETGAMLPALVLATPAFSAINSLALIVNP